MDEAFTQIDFGPIKPFLENDDVTDISYSNNGQVWLKTLSQGVYRVENTGINNQLMEKIAFQCANSMGKSFNNCISILQRYTFYCFSLFFFIEKMSFSVIFFVYLDFLSYFRNGNLNSFKIVYHGK